MQDPCENLVLSKIIVFGKELLNQSIENAGVAFVKRANERNESFEKINKQ